MASIHRRVSHCMRHSLDRSDSLGEALNILEQSQIHGTFVVNTRIDRYLPFCASPCHDIQYRHCCSSFWLEETIKDSFARCCSLLPCSPGFLSNRSPLTMGEGGGNDLFALPPESTNPSPTYKGMGEIHPKGSSSDRHRDWIALSLNSPTDQRAKQAHTFSPSCL